MPSAAINNLTAPDTYTTGPGGSTLQDLPVCDHVNIDVANAAIYWSLQQAIGPISDRGGTWQQEVFMPPGSRPITRRGITGIRFRAAVPAAGLPAGQPQAQVTVEAVY